MQHLIDTIHTFTGLNWWACIALTTVLIRTAMIPFEVSHQKATEKIKISLGEKSKCKEGGMDGSYVGSTTSNIKAMKPELDAIRDAVDRTDPKSVQEGKYKTAVLFRNNMVEKVPSLKGGGVFWFTDLTTPDPLYILPVLTALTYWVTVELNLQGGIEDNSSMGGKAKMFNRVPALMMVPFTANFAKGYFCYWITSNLFTLVYGTAMRRPTLRKLFNFPALEAQSAPALNSALNMFGGSKAVPSAKPPLALTKEEEERLEEERIAALPLDSTELRDYMKAHRHLSLDFADPAALGYRPKNFEKKGKPRGKSRKRK